MTEFNFTPIDIAAFVYGLLALIALWLAFRVLKWLFLKMGEVWSQAALFGEDGKTRLISLGIAALLFPRVVFSLANAILYFIGNFFVDAPQELLRKWMDAQYICMEPTEQALRFCFSQLWFGFIQAWTEALSDAINRFGPTYLPYSQLLLMVAAWAVLAVLLSEGASEQADTRGDGFKTRLQHAFDRLSRSTKLNMLFFVVLILAGYLSIAAITAIPGLQEPAVASEAVSVENLQEQLDNAMNGSVTVIMAQTLTLTNPFSSLTEEKKKELDPGSLAYYTYLESDREQMILSYPKLQRDAQSEAKNARDEAVDAYRVSLIDRKGTQETAQHYLEINSWYRRMLTNIESQVSICRDSLKRADEWYKFLIREPLTFDTSSDPTLTSPNDAARQACNVTSWNISAVPARPELGDNLGPFSFVASWLLQTESLPLAQIVGMLGFGLLGSAVSTLVRSETKRRRNQPLVDELGTVIIRGATAAVVVFLAVKGGLAVFTSGESEPNSYVLLLTCLVAAVYSEDVWVEARKRFNDNLGGEDREPDKEEPTDTSQDSEEPENPDTPTALPPATG